GLIRFRALRRFHLTLPRLRETREGVQPRLFGCNLTEFPFVLQDVHANRIPPLAELLAEHAFPLPPAPFRQRCHRFLLGRDRHPEASKLAIDVFTDRPNEAWRPPRPRDRHMHCRSLETVEYNPRDNLPVPFDPHAGKRRADAEPETFRDEPGNPFVGCDQEA